MIKKSSISIILVFIVFQQVINAQDFRIETPPGYRFIYNSDNLPKSVDGSPYLGDWQKAELYLKNGNVISKLPMRYNVYTGEMIYKQDEKIYAIGAPDSISKIEFPDKIFIHKMIVIDNLFEKDYYEVIVDDEASLFKKYEVVITPSNYNVALDVGDKNDKFTLKEKLFLQHGEKLVEISKKKDFLQFFSDKEKEISKYIKQEKLSYKNEEDLIKLVEYYNQII